MTITSIFFSSGERMRAGRELLLTVLLPRVVIATILGVLIGVGGDVRGDVPQAQTDSASGRFLLRLQEAVRQADYVLVGSIAREEGLQSEEGDIFTRFTCTDARFMRPAGSDKVQMIFEMAGGRYHGRVRTVIGYPSIVLGGRYFLLLDECAGWEHPTPTQPDLVGLIQGDSVEFAQSRVTIARSTLDDLTTAALLDRSFRSSLRKATTVLLGSLPDTWEDERFGTETERLVLRASSVVEFMPACTERSSVRAGDLTSIEIKRGPNGLGSLLPRDALSQAAGDSLIVLATRTGSNLTIDADELAVWRLGGAEVEAFRESPCTRQGFSVLERFARKDLGDNLGEEWQRACSLAVAPSRSVAEFRQASMILDRCLEACPAILRGRPRYREVEALRADLEYLAALPPSAQQKAARADEAYALAERYLDEGDVLEANLTAADALRVRQQLFGDRKSLLVADSEFQLGLADRAKDRQGLDRRLALLRNAQSEYESVLGSGHIRLAQVLSLMAYLELLAGNEGKAEKHAGQAFQIGNSCWSSEHPDMLAVEIVRASTAWGKAKSAEAAGDSIDAESWYVEFASRVGTLMGRADRSDESRLSAALANVAGMAQYNLGRINAARGQRELADSLYSVAERFYTQALLYAPNDAVRGPILSNHGLVLARMGKCELASVEMMRAREIARDPKTGDAELQAKCTANLATIEEARGELTEAVAFAKEAFEIAEAHLENRTVRIRIAQRYHDLLVKHGTESSLQMAQKISEEYGSALTAARPIFDSDILISMTCIS